MAASFDPSVISQIPDGLPNPAGAKQQAYTLAGQIDEQKLNHLKLQQTQEGMRDQITAKNILRENPIDFSKPETITRAAEKISKEVNPDYAMKFMRQSQEVLGGQYENQVKQFQIEQEKLNVVSQSVNPLVTKLMDMERAGATPAMLNASSQAESKKVMQNLLESNPDMKPKIEALLKSNPNGIDFQTLKTIDQNSKSGMDHYKEKIAEYTEKDKARAQDISQQRADQNAKNFLSLEKSRDERAKSQEQGLLEPEDNKFVVSQYLAGDRQATQGLGSTRTVGGQKNWANFRKELRLQATAEAESKGYKASDAGRYVAGKMAEFEGTKAEEKAAGTREAQIQLASNEFSYKDPDSGVEVGVAPIALKASEALKRGEWVPLNQLVQKMQSYHSNPRLYAFAQSLDSAVNVYARAMTPIGVPTDASRQRALDKLSTAQSTGAVKAVFNIMQNEVDAAKKSPEVVRNEIMSGFVKKSGPKEAATPASPAGASGATQSGAAVPGGSAQTKSIGGKTYRPLGGGRWEEVGG